MYSFKRVIVCLDLSENDEAVINYSIWFAKIMGTEYINYVHIAKQLDIPENIKALFPKIETPADDHIKEGIRSQVDGAFDDSVNVHITVREGNFTDSTLSLAKLKKADLIVLGKKTSTSYQGLNARRIANTCHCSVLLVPDLSKPRAERILMPVNFSKQSLMSIEVAQDIRKVLGSKLYLQNIYKVPNGYRYTGKTYDQFAEVMRENAKEEYSKFMSINNLKEENFELLMTLGDIGKAADSIFDDANRLNIDLLIVGSRGRTSVASFILGSTAVGLIRHDLEIPYLIVKQKNKNMGVLDAIQEI